jgi:uncharacterized repeat protein (TIGR03803 family)
MYRLLHTFTARTSGYTNTNPDGASPMAGLVAVGTTLYGTAAFGGTNEWGTIFSISTDGVFTVLYNFPAGAYGPVPLGTLTASRNTLYGTTVYGGNQLNQYGVGGGTVFCVNTDGSGFAVLHNFTVLNSQDVNSDGAEPYSGLVLSGSTLYGTTTMGGTGGRGTLFAVNTNGTGFTVLHKFTATPSSPPFTNADGGAPETTLLLLDDTLYGTTVTGGVYGYGVVFAVGTNGTNFRVLHAFDGTDGDSPSTPLTLYGSTLYGGTESNIFALNTDGTGFTYFSAAAATSANGNLVVLDNTVFGAGGGANGTVFGLQLGTMPGAAIQPQTQTVTVGNPAVFNTTNYGTPPLSFQWLCSGTNILTATNSTFTLNNAFPANAGLYSVVVTNFYGSVTSAPATLAVSPLPLTAPQSAANGQFQFSFNTASGVNYTVQYSTSLSPADWISILTFEGNGGPMTVIDPNATGSSQRFYRIVLSAQ